MNRGGLNILIVGAGPVGLTAALELSRRGFRPRIIDKGADFTPEAQSRALGVNNRTLQLLTPSGVTEKLLAAGREARKFRVINEKNRPVLAFDFDHPGALYPFMLILSQGRTERFIAEKLGAFGLAVEWDTEMTQTNGDPEQPAVTLRGPKGEENVAPDILIGADGANSAVRKAFGFSFDGEGYPQEFGLADIEVEDPFAPDELTVRFRPDGLLAWIPMGGRTARAISLRPDISNALPPELKITDIIWRSSFHISFRHVSKMRRGKVFLAGDAAHIHSPIGARGMNLGIEDACWLAWMIETGAAEDYSGYRLREARKVIAQTKQATDLLFNMNAFARFVRDHIAGALLKFPPFKRAALSRITGLDTVDPPWL